MDGSTARCVGDDHRPRPGPRCLRPPKRTHPGDSLRACGVGIHLPGDDGTAAARSSTVRCSDAGSPGRHPCPAAGPPATCRCVVVEDRGAGRAEHRGLLPVVVPDGRAAARRGGRDARGDPADPGGRSRCRGAAGKTLRVADGLGRRRGDRRGHGRAGAGRRPRRRRSARGGRCGCLDGSGCRADEALGASPRGRCGSTRGLAAQRGRHPAARPDPGVGGHPDGHRRGRSRGLRMARAGRWPARVRALVRRHLQAPCHRDGAARSALTPGRHGTRRAVRRREPRRPADRRHRPGVVRDAGRSAVPHCPEGRRPR